MKFGKSKCWKVLVGALVVPAMIGVLSAEEPKAAKVVQPNQLAGRWYPADAKTLKGRIERLFDKAKVTSKDNVIALILPHAGYQYSGETAAFGVKSAGAKYKRIVVIGPTHHVDMPETLSVPAATHYTTPLGQVPLDVEFIEKLRKNEIFKSIPAAHLKEHSVQIQLPLLQYSQNDFKFVPIVAGTCSMDTIKKAADILKNLVDEQTLVIASSDFVHYGPNHNYTPFKENIPRRIEELDMGAYTRIARLDAEGFLDYKQQTGATICGYIPVTILLSMLDRPVRKIELVKYTTSGKLTGDFTNSVSYLSVIFQGLQEKPRTASKKPHIELTDAEKKQLLMLARRALLYYLEKRKTPVASDLDFEPTPAMSKPGAAFVTIKRDNQLRGCIGETLPQGPLYESVIRTAIKAGVNDWRFAPVTRDEMDLIDFEISALSEPVPIASPNDIRLGTDGVIFKKDNHLALYLPQVVREQRWTLERMLKNLSLKAGLRSEAWEQGAEFMVFQALVFGEEQK